MQNPTHLPKFSRLRLALYKQPHLVQLHRAHIMVTSWPLHYIIYTFTNMVLLCFSSSVFKYVRELPLSICWTKTACFDNVSSWNDGQRDWFLGYEGRHWNSGKWHKWGASECTKWRLVEVGGARTVFASLTPAHFLKRLFIQSEESGKFGDVSRVLHFAVKVC